MPKSQQKQGNMMPTVLPKCKPTDAFGLAALAALSSPSDTFTAAVMELAGILQPRSMGTAASVIARFAAYGMISAATTRAEIKDLCLSAGLLGTKKLRDDLASEVHFKNHIGSPVRMLRQSFSVVRNMIEKGEEEVSDNRMSEIDSFDLLEMLKLVLWAVTIYNNEDAPWLAKANLSPVQEWVKDGISTPAKAAVITAITGGTPARPVFGSYDISDGGAAGTDPIFPVFRIPAALFDAELLAWCQETWPEK